MNRTARKNGRRVVNAAAIASLMLAANASAQILHWDTNGTTLGAGAAGTWDTSLANWSTDPLGQVATQAWVGNNVAQFSAGTASTGSFTVTVPAGVAIPGVNGLTFEEGTVTINGADPTASLSLTNAVFAHGNVGSTASSRTTAINVNLTGTTGLTFATNYTAASTGTFLIGGNNTYTGQTIIRGIQPVTAAQASGLVLRPSSVNAFGPSGVGNEIVFAPSLDATFTASPAASRLEIATGQTWTKDITLTGNGLRASLGQLSLISGSGTWNGAVTVAGGSNSEAGSLVGIGAQGTSTLYIGGEIKNAPGAGSLSLGTAWSKVGTGTVVLAANSPNFVGFHRVFAGVLDIRANGAFGAPSVPGLVEQGVIMNALSVSPTIAFSGGVDYSNYEVITTGGQTPGLGSNNLGMIHSTNGNNRFAGDFRLGGPSTGSVGTGDLMVNASFGVTGDSTFELAGKLWASSATNDVTPRRVTKIGAGTLVISGENNGADGQLEDPNNPGLPAPFPQFATSGTFVVNEGTVVLRSSSATGGSLKGNELGSSQLPGSFNIQVNPGGTFFIDNSLAVNTDRLGSSARALLTGGNLQFGGNSATPVTQSIPGGVVPASFSTITVVTPGADTTLDLGGVARDLRGTALVRGMNGTNARIVSGGDFGSNIGGGGGNGSPLIGIIPALAGDASSTGSGSDFVTNDPIAGLRVLAVSEYAALVSGSSALNNVATSGSPTVTADTTVNALKMAAATNLSINPGTTLNVNSGAVLVLDGPEATSSITGGNINFGGREGIFHVLGNDTLTVSSAIQGTDGITKSGGGNMVLTGTNTYTGPTSVNLGVLQINSFANMGSNGFLFLNGGTLRVTSTDSLPLAREFFVGNVAGGSLSVDAGANLTINTPINGNGPLIKAGAGTLTMGQFNSGFNGALRINGGTVATTAAENLGNGALIMDGGALAVNATYNLSKAVSLLQTATFGIASGQTGTFSGVLSGPGNIVVEGGGTFAPSGNNLYSGVNTVNGSTMYYPTSVSVGVAPAAPLAYWTLNNGTLAWQNINTGTTVSTTLNANRGIAVGPLGGVFRVDSINNGSTTWHSVITAAPLSGTGAFTKLGDGSLTLSGTNTAFTGQLNVNQGILIAGQGSIGGTTITIGIDGGTLRTSSGLNTQRPLIVGAGNATLDGGTFNNTFAGVTGPGTLTKIGTGSLTVASYRARGLDVQAGKVVLAAGAGPASAASASQIGSNASPGTLNLPAGTTLDVTNNVLAVNYSGASPRAALEALVATGYAAGSWNGVGINSSTAAATAGHSVGIAEASDIGSPATYAGQTIDNTTVLVRYTRTGDADLSGTTDIGDFSLLAANFNVAGTRWNSGNFNYDGITDIGDFSLLAANFNASATADLPRGAAVPEPTALALLGIGAAGLLARRRR